MESQSSDRTCHIHKLPAEVLSSLFAFMADGFHNAMVTDNAGLITGEVFTDPTVTSLSKDIKDDAITPWSSIVCVCRYWRGVAVATPSIWAVIIIPSWSHSPFYRVMTQLVRSKNFPLDIRIHMSEHSGCDCPGHLIPMFYALLREIHRWRSIEVRAGKRSKPMDEILDAISGTCHSIASPLALTSVALDSGGYGSNPHGRTKHFALFGGRSVPHLRSISLTDMSVDWNQAWMASLPDLMALQIKCYNRENCPSWDQFFAALHASPRLKLLVLDGIDLKSIGTRGESGDHNMPVTQTRLLELRQLAIALPVRTAVKLLFRCHIPSLEKLALRIDTSSIYNDSRREAFMERLVQTLTGTAFETWSQVQLSHTQEPPCSLTKLEFLFLHNFCCNWRTVEMLYDNLDSLTTLVLKVNLSDNYALIGSLVTSSTQLHKGGVRLPRLLSLSVHNDGAYLDGDAICELAWHRHDIGFPLRALILRRLSFQNSSMLSWCHENLETFYCNEHDCLFDSK